MYKKIITLAITASILLTSGLGCKSAQTVPADKAQPVTLEYWGVFTDSDDMGLFIDEFQKKHPNITINYKKFRPEEYEQKLIEAFAEDRGPDLFSIHNTWLAGQLPKLAPMPTTINYVNVVESGSGMTSTKTLALATAPGLTIKQLRDQFVGVVEPDVLAADPADNKKKIFALPFYLDTLALYYNKDLLSQNGIVKPAADWATLLAQADKLTKKTEAGVITQGAVAMGLGNGVHRAADLVAALMMQSGARMTLDDGRVVFNAPVNQNADEEQPGARALHFYLDFGNPAKKAYSWSTDMGDALDAFAQGKIAYYFGYSYDLPTIRNRNQRLNFDVTGMPQLEPNKPVNIANYWLETVSKKSKHVDEAWLFIMETATNKDAIKKFVTNTKRIAALNEVIQGQLEDLDLGVFAKQALTARSWYHGKNSNAAEQIMLEMIDGAHTELIKVEQDKAEADIYQGAVNRAAARLNETL